MSDLYQQVEQFIINLCTKAGKLGTLQHLQRTVHWVEQLKPDADEALRIAAIAHDIERIVRSGEYDLIRSSPAGFTDAVHLRNHQEIGAKIIGEFLDAQGVEERVIARVQGLVAHHETGGDDDQNVLKDADSISFFENNIEGFLTKWMKEVGKEKVQTKFQWMFDRITSPKARETARPWYEDAVKRLVALP